VRRLRSSSGFTLFDVMQASALSTIALVGISSMLFSTMSAAIRARDLTTATTLAETKLEELRGIAYASVANGSDAVTDQGIAYGRQWAVASGPTASTKDVTLTVTWSGTKSIEVRTIITN
jgi:hypothetical protein